MAMLVYRSVRRVLYIPGGAGFLSSTVPSMGLVCLPIFAIFFSPNVSKYSIRGSYGIASPSRKLKCGWLHNSYFFVFSWKQVHFLVLLEGKFIQKVKRWFGFGLSRI